MLARTLQERQCQKLVVGFSDQVSKLTARAIVARAAALARWRREDLCACNVADNVQRVVLHTPRRRSKRRVRVARKQHDSSHAWLGRRSGWAWQRCAVANAASRSHAQRARCRLRAMSGAGDHAGQEYHAGWDTMPLRAHVCWRFARQPEAMAEATGRLPARAHGVHQLRAARAPCARAAALGRAEATDDRAAAAFALGAPRKSNCTTYIMQRGGNINHILFPSPLRMQHAARSPLRSAPPRLDCPVFA